MKLIGFTGALLLLLPLFSSCAPTDEDLNTFIDKAAAPYRLDTFKWQVNALLGEAGKVVRGKSAVAVEDENDTSAIESRVEQQVREAFAAHDIYGPLDRSTRLKFPFPPVNIHLGPPPHLLVISPRDRIESSLEITLLPDMREADMEALEKEIDGRGVSSLVVELGGLSTYPSFVTDKADIRFILNTAAEEWLHLYLSFTPLGFRYVLDLAGIRPDYEIATINETVAGIVSKEIGGWIYSKYYASDGAPVDLRVEGAFDFNREMRVIRRAIDQYLADGEIEQAEQYMKERRDYLQQQGYRIRKLNQAYFAFHGTYGDSPTSISPIGGELRELRARSVSLRQFIDTAGSITSRADLLELIREK